MPEFIDQFSHELVFAKTGSINSGTGGELGGGGESERSYSASPHPFLQKPHS